MLQPLKSILVISAVLVCCTSMGNSIKPTAVPAVSGSLSRILESSPEIPIPPPPKPKLDAQAYKGWEELTAEQRQKVHKQLDRGWRFLPAGVCLQSEPEIMLVIMRFFGKVEKCEKPKNSKFRLYEELSPAEKQQADKQFEQMWNSFSPEKRQEVLNFKVFF